MPGNNIPIADRSQGKIFCYAPWSNLEIYANGTILPCCKFQNTHYQEKFNILDNTIEQYQSSSLLSEIKKDFIEGTWPRGCERCRIEESAGIPSKRLLDHQRWQAHYDNYDINSNQLLTISMALGNTCNLKCIMCGPDQSSQWAKEAADLYGVRTVNIKDLRNNTIKQLVDSAVQLIHVDIHGGEPFLSRLADHFALLDHYIDNGRSTDISIHYTTNGTIWPDERLFDRWQHFKEIDLQLSIDGIEQRFEYIRFPAKWAVLGNNIDRYLAHQPQQNNFKISVAHTVSAFNVYYLDEFFAWCKKIGLPKPWTGKLQNPAKLRPSVWINRAKIAIVEKLKTSTLPEVGAWAHHLCTVDDSNLYNNFVEFVKLHDQYRQTNFYSTFPELAEFL